MSRTILYWSRILPVVRQRAADVSCRYEPGEGNCDEQEPPRGRAPCGASAARPQRAASCAALARVAGELEEDLLERGALDRELVQDDPVRGGDLADAFRQKR